MIQTMRLYQQCRHDGGESVHFESAEKKEMKEVSPLTEYGISEPDMLRSQGPAVTMACESCAKNK